MSTPLQSRRNVVRTVAWTVPVVAASTAVPAYAASCGSTSHAWRLDWANNTTSDTFPGPVSSFRLDYWSSAGNGQQAVFLSDFTFDALGC